MAVEIAKRDTDRNTTLLAISSSSSEVRNLRVDETTNRLLVDAGTITTSSASVGTTGAAVPASGDYIAGNKAGNLTGLLIGSQTSANSLAVVIASDQATVPVSLSGNQAVNLAQIGGATISTGVGATGSGVIRTVEANGAGRTLSSAGGSAASSGNNTLVAAGTNKLKIYAFTLSTTSTTAMTCIFQSGASGTELWRVILQAGTSTSTGANLVIPVPGYLFATASATLLNLNLSSANAVHWSVSYFDEA